MQSIRPSGASSAHDRSAVAGIDMALRSATRALVAVLGATLFACTVSPPVATPSAPASASVAIASPTRAPSPTPCVAPPQPTYLPWGAARAVERITNENGVEYVRYAGPATSGSSSAYFAITQAPVGRLFPAPAAAPRTVAGRQIVIFRVGDPGVGEVAARWQEGVDGCAFDAHLFLPSAGAADEDEIAKIVASLYTR